MSSLAVAQGQGSAGNGPESPLVRQRRDRGDGSGAETQTAVVSSTRRSDNGDTTIPSSTTAGVPYPGHVAMGPAGMRPAWGGGGVNPGVMGSNATAPRPPSMPGIWGR